MGVSALAKRHQLRRDLLSTMVVSKSNPLLHADPFLPLADTLPQLSAKSKPKNWLDEFLAVGYDVPQV